MKRVVLLGPPGVGKGTQAGLISKKYELTHISTGDIFRANLKQGTPLGLKAKEYMDKGLLVPDELVCDLVKDRVQQDDCKNGFLLDGFPRNVEQAKELEKALASMNTELSGVIAIEVDDSELISRLADRRICKGCGDSYHLQYKKPSVEGKCDHCGGELYQRRDDSEEVIKNRLNVYHEQTAPLLDFYSERKKLSKINGKNKIDMIFSINF